MVKFFLLIFFIIGVIGIVLSIFKAFLLDVNFKEEQNIIYKKKTFLTNAERLFYKKTY